ncbi:uncharacterized protein N0V89_006203 [Didymosphaeria variabile]|uniref:NAD(P)-binding protein n=1 Tax=Didymosphaeria variabile TaxID=1932322 RepID=A0A9W8XMG2_9PLEO|nr:uncharacterized protein N0V89_006203 [Didymosphaeria variabile]KAJ4354466.1 hypothetical protein N0V89_006203 [Didymosphaeria variabile]
MSNSVATSRARLDQVANQIEPRKTAVSKRSTMDVPGFALITGAASGIGQACAKAFAQEGAAGIALLDLNREALAQVKDAILAATEQDDSIRTAPLRIETYAVDVSNEQDVTRAVNQAAQTFGRLDYVVNAAGIAIKHQGGAAFAETQDWQKVLDINLNGTFFVLRAAAQIMLKQDPILSSIDGRPLQRGSIVNFSSIQGVVGITLSTAYTVSKHAVMGLTRTASEDYAAEGLRVNAICPGYTETPMTTKNPAVKKAMDERIQTAVPMQRMGMPREIADDAVGALKAGFAATIRQLPFLAGTIRLSDAETGRLAIQYPESPFDELIDQIFTISYGQAGNPDLEYTKMEKDGFPPLPMWRDVFCPSLLRNHPGLDDEYAAGLISFKKELPVPVLAAQATFVRGGLVLSVYSQHNAIDGSGTAKLYKIWSNHTRLRGSMTIPNVDEGHRASLDSQRLLFDGLAEGAKVSDYPDVRFPGTPRSSPLLRKETYKLVSKIFVFPAATISELAATLSSTTGKRISSFVALISLIWTNVTIARSAALADKNIHSTMLDMAFDHRKNLDEHLKDSYMGNCVTGIQASAPVSAMLFQTSDDSVYGEQLAPIASAISYKLSSITLDFLKARLNLFSRTPSPWQLHSHADVQNGPDLFVTSWMHIGTGCAWKIPGTTTEGPVAIRKPQSHIEGLVHILPKVRIENGFPALDVLVCLEEWEMERVVRRLEGERWAVRVIGA